MKNLTTKVGEEYATDAYGNKICDMTNDRSKKNIRYSHLPNEITGEYYKEKTPYLAIAGVYFAGLIVVTGIILIILDAIFGAETVTNFIADLLGSLMN